MSRHLDPVKDRFKLAERHAYYPEGLVEVSFPFDFTNDDSEELGLTVKAWFRPARWATSSRNPDAVCYGEPGDVAEWLVESVSVTAHGGELAEMLWKDNDAFDEAVGEALLADLEQHKQERAYARAGYP